MKLILQILLILLIVATFSICAIKPNLHKNIIVHDSVYTPKLQKEAKKENKKAQVINNKKQVQKVKKVKNKDNIKQYKKDSKNILITIFTAKKQKNKPVLTEQKQIQPNENESTKYSKVYTTQKIYTAPKVYSPQRVENVIEIKQHVLQKEENQAMQQLMEKTIKSEFQDMHKKNRKTS